LPRQDFHLLEYVTFARRTLTTKLTGAGRTESRNTT
jgi:hypothetical protein